ncbi:MAG: NACHT domain-containing protein [Pirellulaceae bacterium]
MIIDGPKLADLLVQHLPAVAERFGASEQRFASLMEQQLNNQPLIRALQSETRKPLSQFYTDIDFSLGRWTTKLLFATEFVRQVVEHAVGDDAWRALKNTNESCKTRFGLSMVQEMYADIEERADREYAEFLNKQVIHRRLREASSRVAEFTDSLDALHKEVWKVFSEREKLRGAAHTTVDERERALEAAKHNLRAAGTPSLRKQNTLQKAVDQAQAELNEAQLQREQLSIGDFHPNDLNVIMNVILHRSIELGHFDTSGNAKPTAFRRIWDTWEAMCVSAAKELGKSSDDTTRVVRDLVNAVREEDELQRKYGLQADHPEYRQFRFTMDTSGLSNTLSQKRGQIQDAIAQFNIAPPTRETLRSFLIQCESVFENTSSVLSNEIVARAVGIDEGRRFSRDLSSYRLSLSIQSVFETGVNIAVLGEAGAGKTTSLQMYAMQLYSNADPGTCCIFVPLGRMVHAWMSTNVTKPVDPAETLEYAIVQYVTHIGGEWTVGGFRETCRNENTILLLDGIDEAIRAAPWILDGISSLATRYPRSQIITSSRMMGGTLNRIPFLAVTLLPFNDAQQSEFIRLWFESGEEPETSERIIDHLRRNAEIREVVRNPLLATVMCELATHGIQLPHTEVRLYEDRIDLLTGRYDTFKGGPPRLKSRRDDLVHVAKNLAFWLHKSEKREEDREVLYEVATDTSRARLSPRQCRAVVDELIDACEILVPMTDEGKVGFGHLRYQEYLAALELGREQWPTMRPLLGVAWWRDVFVLFARMEESLEPFFCFLSSRLSRKFVPTVRRMLAVRPLEEQAALEAIIRKEGKERLSPELIDNLTKQTGDFSTDVLDDSERIEEEFIRDFVLYEDEDIVT